MNLNSFVFDWGTKGYDLADWRAAVEEGRKIGKTVYCWKSVGVENWLEKGLSISDVFCLVLLPRRLPRYIDLPDDELKEDERELNEEEQEN